MRFQFGEFVAADDARQVTRGGEAVHLSPKAFDLLMTLLRARPRALAKADLHAQLWPNVFVSDASLAMVVAEVRAALGESARDAEWIRTVHRHGYAFQGDARELTEAPPAAMSYWLVTDKGDVPLRPGGNVIGRDPTSDVWLDAPSVSRQHARIHVGPDRVTVEDLQSKNGTFAGDRRLADVAVLGDGQALRFGSVAVTFRAWAPDPTRTESGLC